MHAYLGFPALLPGLHALDFGIVRFIYVAYKSLSHRSAKSSKHPCLLRFWGDGIRCGLTAIADDITIIGDALIATLASNCAKSTIVAVFFLVRGHLVRASFDATSGGKWVGGSAVSDDGVPGRNDAVLMLGRKWQRRCSPNWDRRCLLYTALVY